MNLLREKILIVILAGAIAANLVYLKNYEGFRKKILSGQDTISEDSKTSKKKFVEVVYKPLLELSEDEKAYFKESLKLDLNKAVADDLMEISGIGKSTAQKIVKYREDNGRFKSIDELKEVPGIGETKFETFKYYITVSNVEETKVSNDLPEKKLKKKSKSSEEEQEKNVSSQKKSKKKKKELGATEKADLNNSDFETLRSVKGIGKAAQKIIDYREENNGFKSVEELRKVKGFGPKKFDKVKEFLIVKQYKKRKYTGKEELDPVNINNAAYEELRQIPYVSIKFARDIIRYRESHGGFKKLTELKNIKGIDNTIYKRISKFLVLN